MKDCKHLDMMGLEIEAGWKETKSNLTFDGSLRNGDFYNSTSIGELVSKPFDDKDELFKYMDENWPDEVTQKCGFHIHTSFKNINHYNELMNKKFYNYFLLEMEKWGNEYNCTNKNFWSRLSGANNFCEKKFNPDAQTIFSGKDPIRYTHLNYCYKMHKTIECRLFPTFTEVKTAKSAVDALINCFENYLEQNPPREIFKSKAVKVTNTPETYREETEDDVFIVELENEDIEKKLPVFNLFCIDTKNINNKAEF